MVWITKAPPLTLVILLSACGATPPRPVPIELPELSANRLETVRARAPELAAQAERLQALAERRAAAGQREDAEALSQLAQLTLLSTAELVAQVHAAEAETDAAHAWRMLLEEGNEAAEEEVPTEDPRPVRARRTRPSADAREPTPTEAENEAENEARPDRDAALRARLAQLAEQLRDLEARSAGETAVLDGLQTSLIEADRVLSEGLAERSKELADGVERQLATLTGAPAPAPADGQTFFAEARRLLGDDALIQGRAVVVRLNGLLRYEGGAWRSSGSGTRLSAVRALVRGYRSASVTLLSRSSGDSPFRRHRDGLTAFLAGRFQIPAARLRWVETEESDLPSGTYLLLREDAR
ncbi:MAG: hypothetical protein AAGF12_27925 [Myxococcota bacterium]